MQAIDMGNHFLHRCLATEIATEQLVRPFGRGPAPQVISKLAISASRLAAVPSQSLDERDRPFLPYTGVGKWKLFELFAGNRIRGGV